MGHDLQRNPFETGASPALGAGMFVRADWRFIHEYYTGMCAHMLHTTFGRPLALHEPASIIVFEDHTSYVASSPTHLRTGLVPNVRTLCQAQRDFAHDHGLRFHRTLTDEEAALDDGSNVAGISHAMMAEHYALPGQVVVGTTDMAHAFITTAVRDYCIAQGYDKTFAAVGAQILQPSCGACANCGPGSSTEADQVTVSAINRNFPGRSGPGQVWLASPPTVMASALAGELISFAGLQARVAVQVD